MRNQCFAARIVIVVVIWFGSISTGFADLVAHWKLDDGDEEEFENAVDDAFDGFLLDDSVLVNVVNVKPNADGVGPSQEFAIEFSGDNSWIQTDFPGIGGSEPRTVTFWIKTVATNTHGIVGWGATADTEKWHIRVNNNAGNGVLGAIRTEPQSGQNVASTPVNDGEWHHIASVFPDGATMISEVQHFVDGVLDPRSGGGEREVNTRIGDGAEPVTIGMRVQGSTRNFFPGIVADVRIYDEALEEEDLQEIMEGEIEPTGASLKPGDANGDGGLNLSDPVAHLNFLFAGGVEALSECFIVNGSDPVELTESGKAVLDFNGDGDTNLSDAVGALNFLFSGGIPHALGEDCRELLGDCESNCPQ